MAAAYPPCCFCEMVLTRKKCKELEGNPQSDEVLQLDQQPKITQFFPPTTLDTHLPIEESQTPSCLPPPILDWSLDHVNDIYELKGDPSSQSLAKELALADRHLSPEPKQSDSELAQESSHLTDTERPARLSTTSCMGVNLNNTSLTGWTLLILDELECIKTFLSECNALLNTLASVAKTLHPNTAPSIGEVGACYFRKKKSKAKSSSLPSQLRAGRTKHHPYPSAEGTLF
ncbi:uncharacterized protein LOC133386807 [Rhineura floridana]|uniref:uncharacterized protein LOC133386807 n=1 Tax=Rhineura floridana TaxID=261503 RepID=UPI002AC87DDE|nr:uncharacterized protein LOC133386807 [Rhineura floridana]